MSADGIIALKPGDLLVREKSAFDGLFIIKEGQLEVYKLKDGKKIPLGIIGSGEYVGETSLLLDTPFTSNVVALTAVKAVKIPKERIKAQLETVPPWLLALSKGLVNRLHKANDLLRKHGLVDEKIGDTIKAIEAKNPEKNEKAS